MCIRGKYNCFLEVLAGPVQLIMHRIEENIDSRNPESKLALCCSVGECPSCNKRTNVGVTCWCTIPFWQWESVDLSKNYRESRVGSGGPVVWPPESPDQKHSECTYHKSQTRQQVV